MDMATKHKVLSDHLEAWLTAIKENNREKRIEIINYLVKATRMHRKSIPRAMRRLQMKGKRTTEKRRGRKIYYDNTVRAALHEIWTVQNIHARNHCILNYPHT